MDVLKKDGKKQKFNKKKIIDSCLKVGVSKKVCLDIVDHVINECYSGISTEEIRLMVLEELNRKNEKSAKKYRKYQLK